MPGLLSLLPSRGHEKLSYLCSVNFLDLSDPISVTYHRNTKGSFLIEHVCNSIEVTETDYFGLKYLDNNKLECWIDPTKTVYSQLKGVLNPVVHFRVKFYPSNPDFVKDDVTRYQLYMQVHKDFEEGRLICTLKDALILSTYIVQGELGDYGNEVSVTAVITPPTPPNTAVSPITTPTLTTKTITTPATTAPATYTPINTKPNPKHVFDYVTETRLPESLKDFQGDIALLHKKLRGMDQSTCEHHFLRKASSLNSYGMHPYVVADMSGNNMYLTLTPRGIVVFEDNVANVIYKWQDVKKTSFDGKLFYIKTYAGGAVEVTKGKGSSSKGEKEETRTVAYRSTTSKACKQLWKNSMAHKLFFTLASSEDAPKVVHSGGVLSRGSKFRYSGKCLSELYKNSANTPNEETKLDRFFPRKRHSNEVNKYATIPGDGTFRRGNEAGFETLNASDASDFPYDGSEDEKSILNKTATSIVLNYLSTTKTGDSPPMNLIKRSQTISAATKTSPTDTATKHKETRKQSNTLPRTISNTSSQPRSISANLAMATRAITTATSRLRKFIIHNTTKKSDNKKETKVVYRDHKGSQNNKVELFVPKDEAISNEEDIPKRNSIFEDADLLHGITPSPPSSIQHCNEAFVSSATHPFIQASNHPSTHPTTNLSALPFNDLDKQGFIKKLRDNNNYTTLPTTLNTSTIVTTVKTTQSSLYRNNINFDPNNNVVIGNDNHTNSNENNNYYNNTFNFVDQTIERTERIFDNKNFRKDVKIDQQKNVVYDGNDTGYLSGSDAFNHSFEGQRSSNIKDFFKQQEGNDDIHESSAAGYNKRESDLKQCSVAPKNSREELLNLLSFNSQLMNVKKDQDHNNTVNQSANQQKNIYNNRAVNIKNELPMIYIEQVNEGCFKNDGDRKFILLNGDTFANASNMSTSTLSHDNLSPSSLSSSSTKGSTIVTLDSYECERLEDIDVTGSSTISSTAEKVGPGVNSMGVLSEDNFERIKEIRKLLQENKDKIQEIRENIDSEIRNTFVGSVERKGLSPNYKFCYGDGIQDNAAEDGVCGGRQGDHSDQSDDDDDEYVKYQENDENGLRNIDESKKDDDSEETIFIDHEYKNDLHRNREQLNDEDSRGLSKPKQIAFSTKHYEWYGENGMSSGGEGIIYTFCGGSERIGEGKFHSDVGLVKNTHNQEELFSKDDGHRDEIKERRKASIGRSISSIEGFYSGDNVHHYNPNFDQENEACADNDAFINANDFNAPEIKLQYNDDEKDNLFEPLLSERVVIGGRDSTEDSSKYVPKESYQKEDNFIVSKIHDFTKSKAYATPSEFKANVVEHENFNQVTFLENAKRRPTNLGEQFETCVSRAPKQVSFENPSASSPFNFDPQSCSNHSKALDADNKSSTLENDILTFDKILEESEKTTKSHFCKILTTKSEALKIQNDFDKLNAQNVSGSYSARNFASDLDDLENKVIVEDLILPNVSTLLYDDGLPNRHTQKNISAETTEHSSTLNSNKVEKLAEADENGSSQNEIQSDQADSQTNPDWSVSKKQPLKRNRSCFCTLLTSSIVAIALFSVVIVLLFETNKDREYFEGFRPLNDFRNSVYDPSRHYVVCSIKNHLPKDFFGVD